MKSRLFLAKFIAVLVVAVVLVGGACLGGAYLGVDWAAQEPCNIILFIGDGMHKEHEMAASRYLQGQENGLISMDSPIRVM